MAVLGKVNSDSDLLVEVGMYLDLVMGTAGLYLEVGMVDSGLSSDLLVE